MSKAIRLEEPALIRDFLRGDPAAVEAVNGWIEVVLHRWGPSLRPEWDDLRQEVHARIVQNLTQGSFDGRSALRTYVHRIAQNVCIDSQRRARRLKEANGDVLDAPDRAAPAVGSAYIAREMLARILEGLTPGELSLLRMVHIDLRSYVDVARRSGTTEGAVKLRVFRLRERLVRKYRTLMEPGEP